MHRLCPARPETVTNEAAARSLSAAGTFSGIYAFTGEYLQQKSKQSGGSGGEALAVEVDVADSASVEAMAAAVLDRWGRI